MEEFEREMWPYSLDVEPKSWRDQPPTDKQRDVIIKAGGIVSGTRGEAFDLIADLISSGALTDFLSLAELEAFDPKAGGRNSLERKFFCPLHAGNSRSLNANTNTGAYFCHGCEAKGILREYLGDAGHVRIFTHTAPPKPQEKSDKWKKWWAFAQPIRDTAGAKYLEGRGVPFEVAEAAGVRFGQWWRRSDQTDKPQAFDAVMFPVKNASGNLVAAQARAIEGVTKRTGGDKIQGVFLASPDALQSDRIAICEAPIDALILQACGFPSLAILGKSWPEWLAGALEGKDVAQAQDADKDGDQCAAGLTSLLSGRATTWRLRPVGAKDWAEMAEREGLEAVYDCLIEAMERAPEVAAQ
jgi:hypothetical protein